VSALLTLTWFTVLRFLRESRVVRSVVWPAFLGPATVSLTLLAVAAWTTPQLSVAVPPGFPAAMAARLSDEGWLVVEEPDPAVAVEAGRIYLGTDGETIWSAAFPESTFRLENVLRQERGAAWRMVPTRPLLPHEGVRVVGGHGLRPLAFLYVLYAMVFAMGSVARDRDEAIIDVERSLPVPTWMPGFARWAATVGILSAAWGLTVVLMVVMMDSLAPVDHFLRGVGAMAAAAAVGLALIGGGGIRNGFSAAFATGTFAVAGLIGVGTSLPMGSYLPLASILSNGPGWSSALGGLALGPPAAAIFAWRVGRAS